MSRYSNDASSNAYGERGLLLIASLTSLIAACANSVAPSHVVGPPASPPAPLTSEGVTQRAIDRVFETVKGFVKMAPSHGDRARW